MPEAPIRVVSYDPDWVEQFEREKAHLEALLAPWRRGTTEHVGSTAVVGLCAKPVIDVMVGVSSLTESESSSLTARHIPKAKPLSSIACLRLRDD
jgi:GrpB-like predicted nucleotidyltransferase (UPF0157 family)